MKTKLKLYLFCMIGIICCNHAKAYDVVADGKGYRYAGPYTSVHSHLGIEGNVLSRSEALSYDRTNGGYASRRDSVCVGKLYYQLNKETNTATVVNVQQHYKHYYGEMAIPESIEVNGSLYKVDAIGDMAFYECDSLTNIVMPKSITKIGFGAFAACLSLKSVTIPEGVAAIGESAFASCLSLKSVTIPDNVTTIEYSAFYSCTALTSIVIPNSVTEIGAEAFNSCSQLESVVLSNQIKVLNNSIFTGCESLSRIDIPEGVTSIGEESFGGCTALTHVTIPSTLKKIDGYAFNECMEIDKVVVKATTPPACATTNVFEKSVYSNATLSIPEGTGNAYRTDEIWKSFLNIEEMTEPYEDPISQLVIWMTNGEKVMYALSEKPKITFEKGRLIITTNKADVSYDINLLSYISYDKSVISDIQDINENKSFEFKDDALIFPSLPEHGVIRIFTIDGKEILTKQIEKSGNYALSLSFLNTGIYIVNVNGQTHKILKK